MPNTFYGIFSEFQLINNIPAKQYYVLINAETKTQAYNKMNNHYADNYLRVVDKIEFDKRRNPIKLKEI